MSPLREAFVLPCLFLTVALLGGLRLGAAVHLVPPPLMALVLAVLLLGSLVRAGVFAHERLLGPRRNHLAGRGDHGRAARRGRCQGAGDTNRRDGEPSGCFGRAANCASAS